MDNLQRGLAAAAGALVLAAAWTVPLAARADQPSYYEPPSFKTQIKPQYPESARAKRETGSVMIKVLVAENGRAKSVTIAKSSGHKDLDDEVLRVAKLSTYRPATRNNKPVTAFYDFTYTFTLAGLAETVAAQSDNANKLKADPKNVAARLALIDASVNSKDYAHAESLGDDGIRVLPSDARVWSGRAFAYYSDGADNSARMSTEDSIAKLKTAVDSYDEASRLDPKSVPNATLAAASFDYGFFLAADRRFAECAPYAQKAVTLSPTKWEYVMLKGDCESGQENYKAAVTDYQAAQAMDDKKNPELTSRLLAQLGQAQLQMGDESAGLQSLNQAERVSPRSPFGYQNLASYWITKGNLNAALNPLIQLATLQPTNVQAQINIGDIYVRQKNFAAAQTAYEKAIAIDPKSGDAQFGLAELAAAKGDTKSIDAPLQKAVALSPASAALFNSNVSGLLLQASSAKQDYSSDALRYADVATKADAQYGWGWYYLGIAYADQNKKDQANTALRKAFDVFKSKNDQSGMQQTNQQFMALNGKDNSLITGGGRSERTNQAGSTGGS